MDDLCTCGAPLGEGPGGDLRCLDGCTPAPAGPDIALFVALSMPLIGPDGYAVLHLDN